jgi:hypothetical protein
MRRPLRASPHPLYHPIGSRIPAACASSAVSKSSGSASGSSPAGSAGVASNPRSSTETSQRPEVAGSPRRRLRSRTTTREKPCSRGESLPSSGQPRRAVSSLSRRRSRGASPVAPASRKSCQQALGVVRSHAECRSATAEADCVTIAAGSDTLKQWQPGIRRAGGAREAALGSRARR